MHVVFFFCGVACACNTHVHISVHRSADGQTQVLVAMLAINKGHQRQHAVGMLWIDHDASVPLVLLFE